MSKKTNNALAALVISCTVYCLAVIWLTDGYVMEPKDKALTLFFALFFIGLPTAISYEQTKNNEQQ